MEVMLQRKYEEGYIQQVQQGIHERADKYREVYKACANHLERLAESAVEYQVLKGLGTAGQAVGNFVSSIPEMKNGQVDEWFLANGKQMEQNGADFSKETLKSFQAISEPNCDMFADSLADVNRFFNQTREIYIGRNSVYFVKNMLIDNRLRCCALPCGWTLTASWGGASADAQSYWQGRFAACTLLTSLFEWV